jgi:hypothetical protein
MSNKVKPLTAYNVRTKEKRCPILDPVISVTARGAYLAKGHDGKGNKLCALMTKERAHELVNAGMAKFEEDSKSEESGS